MGLTVLNQQKPEPMSARDDGMLDVQEVFKTIQGEGPFAGTPAVFVRLAGCQLQCPGCDTDYTSRRVVRTPLWVLEEVMSAALKPPQLVVLTGGEPFRQQTGPLVRRLLAEGFTVQVETNGGFYPGADYPFESPYQTIVCSPKTPAINQRLRPFINHFKYVLRAGEVDPHDGLPTSSLGMPGKPYRPGDGFKGGVWVQPMDEQDAVQNELNITAAVKSCLLHGHRLCLQTHKIAGLP